MTVSHLEPRGGWRAQSPAPRYPSIGSDRGNGTLRGWPRIMVSLVTGSCLESAMASFAICLVPFPALGFRRAHSVMVVART